MRSMSTSVLARRKSRRIGTASCTAKLGGICTRRVRCVGAPSLRMSSSAYSSRSKDFTTAGSRCWPALVSVSACGRRSKSCTPGEALERDDMARQRALRDEQRIGRGGKAAVLGDAFEGPQCVQRQPAPVDGFLLIGLRVPAGPPAPRHTRPECSVPPSDPCFQCFFSMRVVNFSAMRAPRTVEGFRIQGPAAP